jgi:hypothetical protein
MKISDYLKEDFGATAYAAIFIASVVGRIIAHALYVFYKNNFKTAMEDKSKVDVQQSEDKVTITIKK